MKRSYLIIALIFVIGVFSVGLKVCFGTTVEEEAVVFSEPVLSDDGMEEVRLSEGIYIGGVSVGGMTVADAREELGSRYDVSANGEVYVNWDDTTVTTTLQALGVSWGVEDALQIAARMSEQGKGIQGYLTQMDLLYGNLQIEVLWKLDPVQVALFVEEDVAKKCDIAPVDAKITREDGVFHVTEHQYGKATDKDATVAAILRAFYSMESGDTLEADAVIVTASPKYLAEDLRTIKDCLGDKGTIYLKDGDQRTERCINVEVATAYIDGTVLLPGESVSTSDLMKDRIEENGYRTGGQMVNGQIEDSIGGGVCQASTTLYNALLEAEIQIDQRKNHSMTVSYVKPSYDAAIATGSKDLVFTNNLEYPIYIQGTTNGNEVVFRVFGTEVRPDNRTIEFVSVEDERIKTEDIYVDDPTMPVGSYSAIGTTHDEVKSHLVKIVYVDGVETERYTLHNDYYKPSQATIKVGTAPVESTASPEASDEGNTDNGED